MDIGEILKRRDWIPGRPAVSAPQSRRQVAPLESLVPGRWIESTLGRCFVSERTFALSHRHGDLPLGDLIGASAAPWPQRFFGGAPFELGQAALVDIETTGLSRGASVYCFLAGLGLVENDHLIVRQFFMPDYGDEPALLDALGGGIAGSAGLITFNGRGFDVPVLDTRYALNGYAMSPLFQRPHLDLLPVARRLWRRMLGSCALSALEQNLLNVARNADDVPGYLIPSIYHEYLLTNDPEGIARVMEHNLMDILSMVCVAIRAANVLAEDAERAPSRYRDPVALGRLHEVDGHLEDALTAYRQGAQASDPTARALACHHLAMLLKQAGRADQAADYWRAALLGDSMAPFIELSKYLEHQLREYGQARDLVLSALDGLQAGRLRCPSPAVAQSELRRRLSRLERKLDARRSLVADQSASGSSEVGR